MSTTNRNRFCRNGHQLSDHRTRCPACGTPTAAGGRGYALRWAGSFAAFVALLAVMAAVLLDRDADRSGMPQDDRAPSEVEMAPVHN